MGTNQENTKRVAKNTGFLFIRMILVLVVGLYTSRLILKYLGFEDFGIYSVVGSVVIFFTFLKTALTNATYRYIAYEIGTQSKENLNKVYSMAINCHCLLALGVGLLLELVGVWFINNKLNISPDRLDAAVWLFHFTIITFCVSIIQNPFHSNIIAHEKMNFYAFLSIVEVCLKLLVVYVIYISPIDRLIAYGFLLSIVSIIICFCYFLYNKVKLNDCRYICFWDTTIAKQFCSYSGWSLIVNVSDICTTQSIVIFFNLFIGVVGNTALGLANQVSSHLNMFIQNFTQAFNPQIIKSYASNNLDYFMKLIFSASKISYYLLFLVSFPIVLNIEFILRIWLNEYPDTTPDYIRVIILYYLIDACQAALWNSVHATGNIKIHQLLMSTIKILAIPAIYFSLKFGMSGAVALSIWVFLNFICAIVRTIYLKRLIKLPLNLYFRDVVMRIVLITAIVIPLPVIVYYKIDGELLRFFVTSILSVIIGSIAILTCGLNKDERNMLSSIPMVKRFIRR